MDAKMIGMIILLVLVLILVITGLIIVRKAQKKVREFSQAVFGTQDIVKGFKQQEAVYNQTPKSVSGATGLYLPQIMRDFPEFHNEEMKKRAEVVLASFLQSIQEGNPQKLSEGTTQLRDKLAVKISALRSEGSTEHFERITIHRTEIHRYRKEKGRCSVVYQSAVGGIHYVERGGKVIQGKKDMITQHRYNVEVCYIQDRDMVEDSAETGFAVNCPNCGAPLTKLGAKICPYCDSPVVEINIHAWAFTDVEAVK